MKKFVSILVSLALVFSFASIGLFAMPDNTSSGSTAIQYSIDPVYIVYIPASAQAGSSLVIGGEGTGTVINTEPNCQVVVTISSGLIFNGVENQDSNVKLVRQISLGVAETEDTLNGTNVLLAPVKLGSNNITSFTHVAEFSGTSPISADLGLLTIGNPDTLLGKLAGNYVGSLTFTIAYTSING